MKKAFVTPKHHSFYKLEFNIGKNMWKHLYHQRIKLAIDINIAETEKCDRKKRNTLSCYYQ